MFNAINAERQKAGLSPTALEGTLTEVARVRSNDMAGKNYFSHTAPDGTTAFTLLRARGISSRALGEIIGRTNGSDNQSVGLIVDAFMNSPGHRAHILDQRYTSSGIGLAIGEGNMKYYTIIFQGR